MSVFILETESVSSAASSVQSLNSQMSSISSSVNGYDTTCEDGFDFAGAKSVIAGNIDACSSKIQNTASLMENVVSSHTSLQGSMQFNGTATTNENTSNNNTANTNNNTRNSNRGSTYTGGSYTGGSYTGRSYTGGNVAGGSSRTGATFATANMISASEAYEESRIGEITADIKKVGYAFVDSSKVGTDSQKLLEQVAYEAGYAFIGTRLVIACDESVGKVGDVIRFTQKDGSVLECVVGVNTSSSDYKDTINVILEKDSVSSLKEVASIKSLIDNNSSIENAGKLGNVVQGTKVPARSESASVRLGESVSSETSNNVSTQSTTEVTDSSNVSNNESNSSKVSIETEQNSSTDNINSESLKKLKEEYEIIMKNTNTGNDNNSVEV